MIFGSFFVDFNWIYGIFNEIFMIFEEFWFVFRWFELNWLNFMEFLIHFFTIRSQFDILQCLGISITPQLEFWLIFIVFSMILPESRRVDVISSVTSVTASFKNLSSIFENLLNSQWWIDDEFKNLEFGCHCESLILW